MFVDGKYVGPAGRFTVPEKYKVPSGTHEISLQDPRFIEVTENVVVAEGKTTKVRYKLKPAVVATPPFGRLRLSGDAPDSSGSVVGGDIGPVYVDRRFMGHIDELNNPGGGILLNPGVYEVRIESKTYGEIKQSVTIKAHKVTVIPLPEKK